MVLELLVADEERDHDHAADPVGLDEDDGRDDDRREGGSGQRNQIEDRDDEPERDRIVAAHGEQDDGGYRPCDEADQQVPRDVPADRPVDLPPDPLVARPRGVPAGAERALNGARALEKHEEREEDDGDDADHRGHHAPDDIEDGKAQPEHASRPLALDRLTDAIDDLVVVLEEAERPSAARQVVDEVGHRVDEFADLGHERRDDEEPDPSHRREREDEDDARSPEA